MAQVPVNAPEPAVFGGRVRLDVAYDGTDFVGWQRQPRGRSVQGVLEAALHTFVGDEVQVEVAGRTDAGVHAEGQVVAFDTGRTLPARAWVHGLNALLPEDVAVQRAEAVAPDFDPRRSARGKHYRYALLNGPVRHPLRRRSHWAVFPPLDEVAMQEGAQALLGRHDFSAFRASDCEARTTERELWRVAVRREGTQLWVDVEGTAFLKHMVRNLVGTLVDVGLGKRPPVWVAEVLAGRDRRFAGRTAPPQGLTLVQVYYP